jgi:3-oxoacyl-[acyl-carrier-protein] synthase-1
MSADLVVTALGMVSPVGANATQTFTSVRANLSRKQECPQIFECRSESPDEEPAEPLVASVIRHLLTSARDNHRPSRWLASLAAHAFSDLWQDAALAGEPAEDVGLYCSLPGGRSGFGPANQPEFYLWFHNLAGKDGFAVEQYEFGGSCTAMDLCERACSHLRAGQIKYAIVGGVDSYLFKEWLDPLDETYRLKSTRNLDGFCPGEAAAFFLIEAESQARQRGRVPWATLAGLRKGHRNGSFAGQDTGEALVAAIGPLLSDRGRSPLLVGDLNGERNRFKEWAFALARLGERLPPPAVLEHPALVLGDVGAATAPVLIALAVQFLHTKYREHDRALVWCAAEDGGRRALLLHRQDPPSGTPTSPAGDFPCL